MSDDAIYRHFFERGEVRPDFTKEYISLWPGWLGKDRLHLLDEVSETEWSSGQNHTLGTQPRNGGKRPRLCENALGVVG